LFRGADLNGFRDIWALPVSGDKQGMEPRNVMNYIPSDVPCHKKQEYVWFRGWDLNSFQDIRAFPVSGGMGTPHMVITYIPSDAPDSRIKGMYGLWVGISTVFQILGHFLFKGEQDHPIW
jgi:hypothetical protein